MARFAIALLFTVAAVAQRPAFTPDHISGIYEINERVGWTITAPARTNAYVYAIRSNGGELLSSGTLDLTAGRNRIETMLATPAMLLVEVKEAHGTGRWLLGAAVAPKNIQPAEPKPADFDAFWNAKLKELDAIPMGAIVKPGDSGRAGVAYETIRLNNIRDAHIYGQLAKPVQDGKRPALVIFQWASPPYPLDKSWITGYAAEGWLVFNVEPHDLPLDMPQAFYDALPSMLKHYETIGQHSREDSYFLPMYLGDYRAVEYVATRPEWDGRTMVVLGTSMGGQQSFAVAGLNPRVTALLAEVPAGCDVTARLHGRAESYPNWNVSRPDVLTTARYFDPANFAPRITARSLVAMGFIDESATPAGIWATFNRIRGPKEVAPMPESPHNHLATPEQLRPWTERSKAWLDALVREETPR
jgi:cephalosporin-C deacetylase